MDLGLRGRAALITASSKGIGRAVADVFAAEGAEVAICARGAADLAAAADAVRSHGTRVSTRVADVATADGVAAAVEAAAELGRLDALVVNAGGPPPGSFADLDDAAWQAAHELTLMSGVRLVRAALPALRRSDAPSVLFISSLSIRQPIPILVLSNSVRLAVAGLAKSLANEIAPVRVNTVLSGMIATDRSLDLARARAQAAGTSVDEAIAEQARTIPLRRYGEPEEIARVCVFLSSPAASYVSGTVLACDGGIIQVPV